jgi:hypothetical protein
MEKEVAEQREIEKGAVPIFAESYDGGAAPL